MQRRRLLRGVALAGTSLLAGCGSAGEGTGGEQPTTTTDDPGTRTPQGLQHMNTTFEVTDSTSGQQVNEARVDIGDAAVDVEGVIWGADGCTTAELAKEEYDPEMDTLTLVVGTRKKEGTEGQMCTQAIVELSYTVRVAYQQRAPERVVVRHRHGDDVTTVTDTGG